MTELIGAFRVAISNISLYPPESRVVKESLTTCYKHLSEALENQKTLTISESESKLLVNGEPVGTSGGMFLYFLQKCKVRSIIFKIGVTQEELYTLLQDLAVEQKPKSSPYIEISEKFYVPVGKKDIIIEAGKETYELGEKIVQRVQELSELIDSIKDGSSRNKIKIEVAKKLSLDDPNILSFLQSWKEPVESKEEPAIPKEERVEPTPPWRGALPPIKEAEELLKIDSQSLLEGRKLQRMEVLLQSLRSPKELEIAGELCNKLVANLEASVSDIRLKTVISFKKLYSVVESLRDKNIVKNINHKFIEAGSKETDAVVYKEIAELLSHMANQYLKEGDYAGTHTITGMLSEHAKSEEFEERKQHAKATIDKLVGSEFTRLLVDDLSSPDKSRREKAISILLDVGDPCVPSLISEIKETSDLRLRKAIADLLVKIGDSAVFQLIEEFKKEAFSTASLRILDILDGVGHQEEVVKGLSLALANPNFQIRRKVVELLYHIGTDSAKEALLEVIDDESPSIREYVIDFLGELQYPAAISKLIKIIEKRGKEEKESIQARVCRALGKIGDTSSIPALFKAALPKTIFYAGKSREVRVAAIESLIKLGDKRANHFMDDKDPFIRKATTQLLQVE